MSVLRFIKVSDLLLICLFFKQGKLKYICVVKKNIMCLYDIYFSMFFIPLFYALLWNLLGDCLLERHLAVVWEGSADVILSEHLFLEIFRAGYLGAYLTAGHDPRNLDWQGQKIIILKWYAK